MAALPPHLQQLASTVLAHAQQQLHGSRQHAPRAPPPQPLQPPGEQRGEHTSREDAPAPAPATPAVPAAPFGGSAACDGATAAGAGPAGAGSPGGSSFRYEPAAAGAPADEQPRVKVEACTAEAASPLHAGALELPTSLGTPRPAGEGDAADVKDAAAQLGPKQPRAAPLSNGGGTSGGGAAPQRAPMRAGWGHKGVCQVDGCFCDLSTLREYHQRYKICEYHLKVTAIMRDDKPQRFCQQCGRFHSVDEFDGAKRSCRNRLLKHNARRRKRDPVTGTPLGPAANGAAGGSGARKRRAGSSEGDSEEDEAARRAWGRGRGGGEEGSPGAGGEGEDNGGSGGGGGGGAWGLDMLALVANEGNGLGAAGAPAARAGDPAAPNGGTRAMIAAAAAAAASGGGVESDALQAMLASMLGRPGGAAMVAAAVGQLSAPEAGAEAGGCRGGPDATPAIGGGGGEAEANAAAAFAAAGSVRQDGAPLASLGGGAPAPQADPAHPNQASSSETKQEVPSATPAEEGTPTSSGLSGKAP
ncbi:Putative squamosa promoter-binding-like protein19 [Monoraphidium neglectum]|uniref:Putative squamosa promoter-binding-like protein19 n=1 Tax=Monoraphidium neglectum TaxID=145388 RepID=A0A0D2MJK1_9CHLO|nr:Putative squamosa promoter-binding-like protein19 [Monoraphidium neglectum]KIZ00802.1 Putative squamosa promoter-binding-like protein19 [Monoraphidium neglectum]|eukprot:XP_013899821.1 Putative squamosa promoter-binding-like protein19 [Monoraphidium neglectum]